MVSKTDEEKNPEQVEKPVQSTRRGNRWWWSLPVEELDRIEEEGYRRLPVQPDEFYIHPDKRARPDDWDNDAFWERFYQEWLKEQEGNSAEPSAQQG